MDYNERKRNAKEILKKNCTYKQNYRNEITVETQ